MQTINTKTLEDKLLVIENYIPFFEKVNPKVSKATVGWQLDHSLKVINNVLITMKKSDASAYTNNFKLIGKILLLLKSFPRGRSKAPKHVVATKTIEKEDLISQLASAKENINLLPTLEENAYFKHPMFGNINKKRVLAFLETHTNHHLKIVKSILNN